MFVLSKTPRQISGKISAIARIRESNLFDQSIFSRERQSGGMLDRLVPLELSYLENRKYWGRKTSSLFDGHYYLAHNSDVRDSGLNPLVHYIEFGFHEGRNPTSLVDIDYIVRQLEPSAAELDQRDFKQVKLRLLSGYSGLHDLLLLTGSNPCFFFDNDYFGKGVEGIEFDEAALPIERYYRLGGRHPQSDTYLECTHQASLGDYMAAYPDLRRAGVIPLEHLVENGIVEGRKFGRDDAVNSDFLNNTASLFRDDGLRKLPGFLGSGRCDLRMAGPGWHTPFRSCSIPALAHVAPAERRRAFVGIVLFNNSDEELRRLQESIANEIAVTPGYDIDYRYLVNDSDNLERYAKIVDHARLVVSQAGNIGFGRGHNVLMRECFSEDRLYIGANPDGHFVPGCMKALVDFNDFYDDNVLIEASALPVDHPKWHDPIFLDTQWVSGACFALSKKLWSQLQGFDENIHMYCEDVDMSWRAKLLGAKLKVCTTARFVHDVTPRFREKLDEDSAKRRRIAMLSGAYYLARKWGRAEDAEKVKDALWSAGLSDPRELTEPGAVVDPVLAAQVADFTFSRYAPSRFWGK